MDSIVAARLPGLQIGVRKIAGSRHYFIEAMEPTRPYDFLFKNSSEEDPRSLLDLVGALPASVEADVEPMPRELLASEPLKVDQVFRVSAGAARFLVHLECESRWKRGLPERLAWYGNGLTSRYRMPVRTTVSLLSKRGMPDPAPAAYRVAIGALSFHYRYRVKPLWKQKPGKALSEGRDSLLPWIAGMNASLDEIGTAGKRIAALNRPDLAAQFVIFGSYRYGKQEFEDLLERAGVMLSEKTLRDSWFYRSILDEGRKAGQERGQLSEVRASIRTLLEARFPGLDAPSWLATTRNIDELHAVFQDLARANSRAAAQRALRRRA